MAAGLAAGPVGQQTGADVLFCGLGGSARGMGLPLRRGPAREAGQRAGATIPDGVAGRADPDVLHAPGDGGDPGDGPEPLLRDLFDRGQRDAGAGAHRLGTAH